MREKQERLIITFHTTADAIHMEKEAKQRGLPGRLIPVPRAISAGCGMSWAMDPAQKEAAVAFLHEVAIPYQEMHVVLV